MIKMNKINTDKHNYLKVDCAYFKMLNIGILKFLFVIVFMTISFSVCACSKEVNVVDETATETKLLSETLGISLTDYRLILANIDNSIGDYTPELVEIEHGRKFDYRAAEDLKKAEEDLKDANTHKQELLEQQNELFRNDVLALANVIQKRVS